MADNNLFSDTSNHRSFANEGLDMLPLITKERTQKFELLQHLIPNLKQHLIVSGVSGIGKTLLLDMLYDIDSKAWQCCFVQGSAELSFENIEAQLTKTMLRNNHESLDQAFHEFQEKHKKIVLIIDDAGLCVSGLMTTLIDYAASQTVIKLIFSLTPEAQKNHLKNDKALENCYLLEIPLLSKPQCAYFLRHLAMKPRTYSALPIDEKLLDKIYHDTNGIPAKIMATFTKLSRENPNDYKKWFAIFTGLIILTGVINQGFHYFKKESTVEKDSVFDEKAAVAKIENTPILPATSEMKTEQDIIIPEFKLDIEKDSVPTPISEVTPVEKPTQPITNPEPGTVVEPVIELPTEPTPELIPTEVEPEKPTDSPAIAFPNVKPAKGMKIQALPEKSKIEVIPIPFAEIKTVKIEPVKKVEIKRIEKPVEVKKPEPPKVDVVKKVELKIEENKVETIKKVELKTEENKVEITAQPQPSAGRYVLQLITLSNQVAIEAFQKKHPTLKNTRIVKSGIEGQERFSLMYGDFANTDEATKSRVNLPPEFANALPRKLNP